MHLERWLDRGSRAVVIVAHPDDETIWMGGTMLTHPSCKWTIFSLCRGDDADRAPRFLRACARLGGRGIITNFEDEGIASLKESVAPMQRLLLRSLPRRSFDILFTHGPSGEYGHTRHKGAFRAVQGLLREGKLRTKRWLTFSYRLAARGNRAVPHPPARDGVTMRLSPSAFQQKRAIIREVYNFPEQSFEVQSAARVETFRQRRP